MSARIAPDAAVCTNCRWWNSTNTVIGECRGRAPIFADNLQDPRAWPYTRREEFCGDFSARGAPAPAPGPCAECARREAAAFKAPANCGNGCGCDSDCGAYRRWANQRGPT